MINLPHPLLASGLVVLDTAGLHHARLRARALVPSRARCRGDRLHARRPTRHHRGTTRRCGASTSAHRGHRGDLLRGAEQDRRAARGRQERGQVLVEIDRQVRARRGHAGCRAHAHLRALGPAGPRTRGCRATATRILRSRLYRLEQALARGMVHQRRARPRDGGARRGARRPRRDARAGRRAALEFAQEQLEELDGAAGQEPEAGGDPRAQGRRRSAAASSRRARR